MLPLLIKDGLVLAFIVTSLIFIFVVYVSKKNDLMNEDFWPSLHILTNHLPKSFQVYVENLFKISVRL